MPAPLATSLHTAGQVGLIDRAAIDVLGIPGPELMRRAAVAAFALLRRRWPDARRLLLLAGNGNNGGDAFLLGALALREGMSVEALALSDGSRGDAVAARAAFAAAGGRIMVADAERGLPEVDVVVDGLFGTGLARPPAGVAAALIERLAAARVPTLALDVPSGLDADSGVARGPAVRADATICFVAWKRGMFTADAADHCGVRELASLDLPDRVREGIDADAILLDAGIDALLEPRRANSNKGCHGHVLVAGGDTGMAGAARLAAEAALRCGAGLVSVATRARHVEAVLAGRPELMVRGVDTGEDLGSMLERAGVVALGPGLGQADWGRCVYAAALDAGRASVIDADGLNLLAQSPRDLPAGSVLTPHPGEAARLLGIDVAIVQRDRFGAARALAQRYRAVAVLKGAGSLVAGPDGHVAVCPWGNPGMATAGMGDVLTGVIAALLAQDLGAWDAACLGVALHARAGDLAAGTQPRGLVASDLHAPLRRLCNRSSP